MTTQAKKKMEFGYEDAFNVDRELALREAIIRMAAKDFFNMNPSTREITVAISEAGRITVDLSNGPELSRRLRGLLQKISEGGVALGIQKDLDGAPRVFLETDRRTLITRDEMDKLSDEVRAREAEIVRFFGCECQGIFDAEWLGRMFGGRPDEIDWLGEQ